MMNIFGGVPSTRGGRRPLRAGRGAVAPRLPQRWRRLAGGEEVGHEPAAERRRGGQPAPALGEQPFAAARCSAAGDRLPVLGEPARQDLEGHLGVELDPPGGAAQAEDLRVAGAAGDELRLGRQPAGVPPPLEDEGLAIDTLDQGIVPMHGERMPAEPQLMRA